MLAAIAAPMSVCEIPARHSACGRLPSFASILPGQPLAGGTRSRRPARIQPAAPVHRCGPKSPDSHRAVRGLISRPQGPGRALLRFPVCPVGSFPSSASFRFPSGRRSPVQSLRPPLSGSVPRRFPLRFPFPSAISTLALPRAGPAGIGPVQPGPRSPAQARSLAPTAPVRLQPRMPPGANRDGARRRADECTITCT